MYVIYIKNTNILIKYFYILQWTPDGHNLLCQCGPRVSILDTEATTVVDTIPQRTGSVKTGDEEDEEDECTDSVITFTLDPTSKNLITSHKSGLLCTWDWNGKIIISYYIFNTIINIF